MSIRRKIQITMIIVAVVCSIAFGSLVSLTMLSFADKSNNEMLTNARALATTVLEEYRDDAVRLSFLAAEDERLKGSVESYHALGERQPLIDVAVAMMNSMGVDFITVTDAGGNVLARSHEADRYGDSLSSQADIKSAMQGGQYPTVQGGTDASMSVRCGAPIYDDNNSLIGVVSLGRRLDQNVFVDYVKKMTNTEVTVFLGDTRISTTVLNENGERAIGTRASEAVSSKVLAGGDYTGRADVVGKNLLTHYSPIRDADGNILGMLFVGLDTSSTDAHIRQNLTIFAIDVIALLAASWFGSVFVSRRIAAPIIMMAGAAKRLAEGDMDVEIGKVTFAKTKDETIQLKQSFSEMIKANRERAQLISTVAHGDLSGRIVPNSDKDMVGMALAELLDKNNASFSNITQASKLLDRGSAQVADGAQNLANSASEQASIVDRLHLTLSELSGKTKENVEHANRAAALSESVKDSAENGGLRMSQMIDAVGQISQASESIGKVIKVIDDIAFQTNILALNASVEAARAGQHGQGFAVVADEVRSLAAKSADAAKETGALIENSMEKAKLGAQISTDTATAFADIVRGVNESSTVIKEIVELIQTQNADILNITTGVDEIGSVIHSVSAAAEQSSAASEEMSAQASHMAATLSRYKLRGDEAAKSSYPDIDD